MKTFLNLAIMNKPILILATVIIFVTIGCEKENIEMGNQIEFEGEVYPLDWGVAHSLLYKGLYDFTLRLLPSTMYLDDDPDYIRGPGTFVGVNFKSSSQTPEGTYLLPGEGEDERKAGQILFAAMVTWPSEDGYIFEKKGKLVIKRSGDNYEIRFTGMDDEGRTIHAYYKGALSIYKEVSLYN
jgi:hypothetical protein